MAKYKQAIEVSIPDFGIEELKKITSNHDTDEVMRALGYIKKDYKDTKK